VAASPGSKLVLHIESGSDGQSTAVLIRTALMLYFLGSASLAWASSPKTLIQLGESSVPLNGPWKFHRNDDPRWADPSFDDDGWESVDLTPPPGARDNDVGFTGFVPGWAARGHAGYVGFAWYRLRFRISPPPGGTLALDGPFVVDSAYQAYLNGRLLGGVGDFERAPPTAYGFHRPRLFVLPADLARGGDMLLAVRVWMGAWGASDPEGGGIHIAPVIGESAVVAAHYRLQWLEVFEGYVVDAVEGLLFLALMIMVLSLAPFDREDRTYIWMAAALLLLAIIRGNQAFLFWWQFETIHDFELFIATLAVPLSLGAWVIAWRSWFALESFPPKLVAVLTAALIVIQFMSRSWFYGVFPHAANVLLHYALIVVRLGFLLLFFAIIVQGVRARRPERWFVLPAMLTLGVGLFAQELSTVGVPGIWFPYGVGVSRTEYAYAVFDVVLFFVLQRRLSRLRWQRRVDLVV